MPRLVSKGQAQVSAAGGKELKKLHRKLKRAGRGDLREELKEGITDAARPTARDITSAVRKVQVQSYQGGDGSPSPNQRRLRRHIARNITVSQSISGVRIHVRRRAFPNDEQTLPKYLDGELNSYKRWRHQIFADGYEYNPDEAHNQYGQPYFFNTIRRHYDDFERSVLGQMEEIADRIARK